MQLNITARHLYLTPALSDYVRRKIEKAHRYLASVIWAQAILSVEKHRHIAEVVVHTPGNTFRTKSEAGDLYSAIDMATHKLDNHLSRVKDKQRGHRTKINSKRFKDARVKDAKSQQELEPALFRRPSHPALPDWVTEVKEISLKALTLNYAIRELNSNSLQFLPFVNERTNRMNVLYKKGKGAYGLLEVSE